MSTNLYKIVMICVPLWYLLSFLHEDFAVRSVSGLVIGQLLYDSMHDFIHFGGHGAVHPWLQGMRDRHMRHHYRHKNKEFGVTTGFWDFVFDTA